MRGEPERPNFASHTLMLTLPPRDPHPLIAGHGTFPYRTAPMAHQRDDLRRMARRAAYAWFWQQGTGKSFVEINNAAYAFLVGSIDALVHVAPIGAHRAFLEEQVPEHMPEMIRVLPLLWNTGKMQRMVRRQVCWKEDVMDVANNQRGSMMPVISIGIDALATDLAQAFLRDVFRTHRIFMAVDESIDIANAKSRRWTWANHFGQLAAMRRILNGTPMPEGSPFHVYGQMRFLDPRIFAQQKFFAFQQHYAVMERIPRPDAIVKDEFGEIDPVRTKYMWRVATDPRTGEKQWRNVDELQRRIYTHASRYLKDDVLDLPPKVYEPLRYFQLTREQRNAYDALVHEFMYENPTGGMTYAELAIVRLRRLYQITRGYVGVEGSDEKYRLPGKVPSLDLLQHMIEEGRGQPTLLWVWEKLSQEMVGERLRAMGVRYGRYDGSVTEAERARAKQRYLDGTDEILMAQPQAFGRAHTVLNTQRVIYYENDFKYFWRDQSEDRPHRAGQTHSVLYSDLVAEATIDESKVVRALRLKRDASAFLTGDPHTDWI